MLIRNAVCVAALLAACGSALAQGTTGPSSSASPYLVPFGNNAPGQVSFTSILTVGDTVSNGSGGSYRLVGIPDGIGAFSNGDGTFSLLLNHELGNTAGVVRAHGSTGAFVSRWNINASNLAVNSGRDHNTSASGVNNWNGAGYTAGTTAWSRFCSGDLAPTSAYSYTDGTGTYGTTDRIFMGGEETGAEGRAYAHVATGSEINTSWQLPALGRFSWENSIANPKSQRKTIVAGTDDSTTDGGVYFYVGDKQNSGNAVTRAGLTNGNLYGLRVTGGPTESRTAPFASGSRFDLFNHGDVRNTTGAALNTASVTNNVTGFLRPEDGAWDPRPGHENDFYFVTTDRYNNAGDGTGTQVGRSRLWRTRFDDISNPTAGGTVTALLDGTEGQQMLDNICIDTLGRIILQEDVGNNQRSGRIWLYDTTTNGYGLIAQHDATRFGDYSPATLPFSQDEESSGITDASDILGPGYFFLNVQAHYSITGELVEGGQLLSLYIDPSVIPAPGAAALLGLGGILAAGRRRR